MSNVFLKAIFYNYFKRRFASNSNKTCDDIVNVLRVDNDCEHREMSVEFISDRKSLWKLRPCLNDLFGEFNVEEIIFVDHGLAWNWRIGLRKCRRHLLEFISQIVKTSRSFCNELNLDLTIKYFATESSSHNIYNR